ncbi:hypothetical protein LWI29_033397 [Acer saccharum]|uniref:Uncharacterized protein n=1 Tax=Acer saccharum TaxID=4024 RepID=A0AA39RPG7_ACESA|nr:hypothetical protein LWI29_033397 [Acer saccharum]
MRRFGDHSQLSELDSGETELLTAMLVALESAGALRGKAARGLVEILSPIQTVKVLAAAAQLHLKVRRHTLHGTNRRSLMAKAHRWGGGGGGLRKSSKSLLREQESLHPHGSTERLRNGALKSPPPWEHRKTPKRSTVPRVQKSLHGERKDSDTEH